MKIMIAGLPGSGKTTQAQKLSQDLDIPYVSMGAIFREEASKDTEIGKQVKETVSKGELIDDELTSEILKNKLSEDQFKGGFIVDGYPRSVGQVGLFDPGYDYVFYLKVSFEEGLKRLLNRHRSDDVPLVIKHRQEVQQAKLDVLLDFLKKHYEFVEINGEESIEEIHAQIIQEVGGK
jgi:adenylate kinase